MAKTNLEKSHSKVSNFKLTLICLILALGFGVLWVGIGLIHDYEKLGYIITAIGGVSTLVGLLLVNKFSRG